MALYNEKIGVFNDSQMMWDSFQTSTLMQKNFPFIVSETLVACASPCLRTLASDLHTQVLTCVCKPRVSLSFYFSKINLFAHKNIFFPF